MELKVKKTNAFVDSRIIYALAVPGAIIYMTYLWITAGSFGFALIGYVTLGICFGSLLSLVKLEKPYRTAVISSALIPLIAYIFVLFLGYLAVNDIIKVSIPASGGAIPLTAYSYQERLGMLSGAVVYAFLVFIVLTVPFGIIGYCGMFVRKGVAQAISSVSKGDAKGKLYDKEIRIEKIKTLAVVFTSLVSGVISVVIALIK